MNILMVLDHDYPSDVRVEKEIKALTEENHKIILACYNYKGNKPLFESSNNLKIYRKQISKLTYKSSVAVLKFPLYFNFWEKFISKILKKETIDAIHIHDLPLAKIGWYFKQKKNIPLIVDLHENWPASTEISAHTNTFLGKILSSPKQWRNYEKKILLQADAVITVVDEMKDRIVKLGIPKEKVHIVSNTLDFKDFPVYEPQIKSKYINLFYAGGINIHRGLQIVIKALPLIVKENNNVRLNIVGSGSYQKNLETLVKNLSLEQYVNFLGWKNMEEIAKALSESDIALIPHLKSEQTDCSSPNKIYQYIYAKKPILTSNCLSLVRMVNETKSGIAYIHDSPEDFKRAFFEIIENKNEKIDLDFGLNSIHTKYNWSVDAKTLTKVYGEYLV